MKNDPEQKTPLCPTCGKPMKVSRVISEANAPDIETLECHFCGFVTTRPVQKK